MCLPSASAACRGCGHLLRPSSRYQFSLKSQHVACSCAVRGGCRLRPGTGGRDNYPLILPSGRWASSDTGVAHYFVCIFLACRAGRCYSLQMTLQAPSTGCASDAAILLFAIAARTTTARRALCALQPSEMRACVASGPASPHFFQSARQSMLLFASCEGVCM
jgi:hypothetical protein